MTRMVNCIKLGREAEGMARPPYPGAKNYPVADEQVSARLLGGGFAKALRQTAQFLKDQKIALQYIPERLIVRDVMPSTPSGKIQKFKLRDMLRDEAS